MKRHFSTLNKAILKSYKLGPYELQNRFVMAAMTRCRADPKTGVPSELHEKYYSERSENTGMILTECSSISRRGDAFPGSAGIWSDEQVEGWKKVTDAVHKNNTRIYLQIWHGGRQAKKSQIGQNPVAPSPIPVRFPAKNEQGYENLDTPEELTEDGIKSIIDEFKKGAENALKAGFDGLELHGANGYLIDQFLRDFTNQRKDKYGGSVENRVRFPLMVIDALTSVFGADKVGIKLSPIGRYGDMFDSNPIPLYKHLLEELSKRKISFVELMRGPELFGEGLHKIKSSEQIPDVFGTFRSNFIGTLIGNNNLKFEEANTLIENKVIDLASFGRPYIANPDAVNRYINNFKLANYNMKTVYFGGADGYVSYPKYQA
jgi:N-ethylmaleimide reductase